MPRPAQTRLEKPVHGLSAHEFGKINRCDRDQVMVDEGEDPGAERSDHIPHDPTHRHPVGAVHMTGSVSRQRQVGNAVPGTDPGDLLPLLRKARVVHDDKGRVAEIPRGHAQQPVDDPGALESDRDEQVAVRAALQIFQEGGEFRRLPAKVGPEKEVVPDLAEGRGERLQPQPFSG